MVNLKNRFYIAHEFSTGHSHYYNKIFPRNLNNLTSAFSNRPSYENVEKGWEEDQGNFGGEGFVELGCDGKEAVLRAGLVIDYISLIKMSVMVRNVRVPMAPKKNWKTLFLRQDISKLL
jgi:hypothetical protein